MKEFGSWPAAMEAAGLEYSKKRSPPKWTRQKVLSEIRRRHRLGLSVQDKAAGVEEPPTDRPGKWNKERLAEEISKLASSGYFVRHGFGLTHRVDLREGIRRHFKDAPSNVVRRILDARGRFNPNPPR